jgi:hypothetical protein
MAKRKNGPTRPKSTTVPRASNTTTAEQRKATGDGGTPADQIEPRMAAFAEQLGRTVGTMQVTAEEWMNRETVLTQLAAVRDGAARLLNQLTNLAPLKKGESRKPVAARGAVRGRSGGAVDAPGKKHRKQGPKDPGAALARSQAAKQRAAMPMMKTSKHRGRG